MHCRRNHDTTCHGSQHAPTLQIDPRVMRRTVAQSEAHPLLRAVACTVHAEQAFTAHKTGIANRPGTTVAVTGLTIGAESLRGSLQDGVTRTETEQSSQRTEILAPETVLDPLQEYNRQEDQESKEPQGEDRLMERHEVVTKQRI